MCIPQEISTRSHDEIAIWEAKRWLAWRSRGGAISPCLFSFSCDFLPTHTSIRKKPPYLHQQNGWRYGGYRDEMGDVFPNRLFLFSCRPTKGVLHRDGYVCSGLFIFTVQQQAHSGFCHLGDWLDNGGAEVATGCEILYAIIADDLHILRNPNFSTFREIPHQKRQSVRIAEYAVKLQLLILYMFLQEAKKASSCSPSSRIRL